MITEVSFLHAIRDSPGDDDLLLVFADWLDEHEDARAASIRAMVAWTRRAADDPARDDDETRFKALCHDAAEAWLGPLHKRVISWCVVGGLLQIRARARAIYRLLDDPEARRVFARVGLLDLVGDVEVVKALLALPDWLTLSTLDLGCNGLTGEEAGELAKSPDLARLSSLLLYDNEIGDWGALCLARSPHVSRLRELDLRRNQIESGGALALAASPYLHPAIRLDLEGNTFNGWSRYELRRRLKGARW